MPIYAYKCENCGHATDVLRKISDPPLTECPACGQATFVKQVTAAGFQLKGSGWYVTDFREGKKTEETKKSGDGEDAKPSKDSKDAPATTPAASPAPAAAEPSAVKSSAAASPVPSPAPVSTPTST